MTEARNQQYLLLLEFMADLVSPEGYGHALPVEVVKRAARILKMTPPAPPVDAATRPLYLPVDRVP